MPRQLSRTKRTQRLIKAFIRFLAIRSLRQRRRARLLNRALRRAALPRLLPLNIDITPRSASPHSDSDSSSTGWSLSGLSSASSSDSSRSDLDSDDVPTLDEDDNLDMPELLDLSNEEDNSDSEGMDTSSDDLDSWGEVESSEGDESGEGVGEEWSDNDETRTSLPSRLARSIRSEIDRMYEFRYEQPRTSRTPAPPHLPHVLYVVKYEQPAEFRRELRVTPSTFDKLLDRICNDPVFSNNSANAQMPVENQLAITLWRFGHHGNASSQLRTARWAGCGVGTVSLVTRRVMTAILRRDFMEQAVRWPTRAEKHEAMRWVAAHSCNAWRKGWLMVDGTLVPLQDRPFWYGESYFDRKSNYSLNIQACTHMDIVSMPNLRIIDFSYGYTGSAHDSTAWAKTRIYQEHDTLLEDGEFIWGDSAYPVSHASTSLLEYQLTGLTD
ncbi:hypothetical protein FA95DRAFT_1618110 [Auriscalpium vulgare]|uniref:Uncharacterized protein n=1 Tax=Auriscalpium vulgare TaxID=40419 RepID=A0ACB8RPX4_9AGAM|nr:hypothetical protein FA95DRAFT_1618110 [Auriscalpium vulgare]